MQDKSARFRETETEIGTDITDLQKHNCAHCTNITTLVDNLIDKIKAKGTWKSNSIVGLG